MKDITNQKFNRWTAIKFDTIKGKKEYWTCQCVCDTIKSVRKTHLVYGKTKSCGCWNSEVTANRNKANATHGMTGTKEFKAWESMKQRCMNSNTENYPNYGGRVVPITVCERWLGPQGFINFYADLGPAPKGYSLDRIDVNGNYEPSNCKWSTAKEQQRNRRVSAKTDDYDEHMRWRNKLISNLNRALDQNFHGSCIEAYLGCTIQEFKVYIEAMFLLGMNWHNHGRNKINTKIWQLDHIIPCNQFDLSKEEDRLICFNYKNFQPMWWEDNQAKRQKDVLIYA
jgi:hypothetical protein